MVAEWLKSENMNMSKALWPLEFLCVRAIFGHLANVFNIPLAPFEIVHYKTDGAVVTFEGLEEHDHIWN